MFVLWEGAAVITRVHHGVTETSVAGDLVGFVSSIITLGTWAECCSSGIDGFRQGVLDKALVSSWAEKERAIGESIMDDGSLMWRQNEFSGCFLKALVGGSPSRGKPALAHLGGGGQHFHQSPERGTEKLIRFVEHLGFIHVRCQKRGVAVDHPGCWWRWSSQEGRKWEVRVTLAVKSPHVNCWFAVNIGFLNKERTRLWSFLFKRWKLKQNMHKNDGICRMNKDLFSKFYDPN